MAPPSPPVAVVAAAARANRRYSGAGSRLPSWVLVARAQNVGEEARTVGETAQSVGEDARGAGGRGGSLAAVRQAVLLGRRRIQHLQRRH
jgi:hypothetical protein